ncbi:hypothetical protein RHRU231_660007 [Rhodococcus ruber]|uniref:Ferric oxidoreductase domain-containing protein n=1 Tax=Rhodococcus ruber TaxID=1830 RepID=A0A098BR11_9NOCA|nr:hypothetical protein RHRU231_660007 [Rhodococcus ruber]
MSDPHLWWYVTRASALVAWVTMTTSALWGVLLSTRILRAVDNPAWLHEMHRWLGGTALIMTGLHLFSLMLDTWTGSRSPTCSSRWLPTTGPGRSPWASWRSTCCWPSTDPRCCAPACRGGGGKRCTTAATELWCWCPSTPDGPAPTSAPGVIGSSRSSCWSRRRWRPWCAPCSAPVGASPKRRLRNRVRCPSR